MQFDEVLIRICETLEETENIVGFVSPSHQVPQVLAIIRGLHKLGKHPIIVYNTNGYDKVETLRMLDGLIDVYLPDIKYADFGLAKEYSNAPDYPEVALLALKEMVRQKGTSLIINDKGIAESGIIIRHLILPGHSEQSIDVFKNIESKFSTDLHFSIMAQYYPTCNVSSHRVLGRTITQNEYNKVIQSFNDLGFYRGWIQDLESHAEFRPNFLSKNPFE
jgi:putative pyruvate formate lyase activating enzyme